MSSTLSLASALVHRTSRYFTAGVNRDEPAKQFLIVCNEISSEGATKLSDFDSFTMKIMTDIVPVLSADVDGYTIQLRPQPLLR